MKVFILIFSLFACSPSSQKLQKENDAIVSQYNTLVRDLDHFYMTKNDGKMTTNDAETIDIYFEEIKKTLLYVKSTKDQLETNKFKLEKKDVKVEFNAPAIYATSTKDLDYLVSKLEFAKDEAKANAKMGSPCKLNRTHKIFLQ